jgi:hypothetical protein
MFTPQFASGPQIARAGGMAVMDAAMAALAALEQVTPQSPQGNPTAQPGNANQVTVVIADPWVFPQGYQRPQGPPNSVTPAEIAANPYERGTPSRADRREIGAILENQTFDTAAVELYEQSDAVDGELGVLRVHERGGVYYVYSVGAVSKNLQGTPYAVIPGPVDPALGRHVFDVHPHPGETSTPSGYFRNGSARGDLAVAYGQGVPNAIVYGKDRHGEGRYSVYQSDCKRSAAKAGTC